MKDYLRLWADSLLDLRSVRLAEPVNVVGEVNHHLGPRWEFAKVQLTAYPSEGFQVEDETPQREQLDRLGVGWPDSAILGILDILMLREFDPLYNVRIALEQVWYSEVDSSERAFRRAGRKLIDVIREKRLALF